jgi:MYXO-CTERM domain-containing protein
MTTGMVSRRLWFYGAALWLVWTGSALAGPREAFSGVRVASDNPERLVLRYQYGDGGMYFSDDGGASFRVGCFRALKPSLTETSVQAIAVTRDGSVCAGTGDSVFCSNPQGCGWQESAELKGEWIADFHEDPLDANVLYLATSTASKDPMQPRPNGLWRRVGADGTWEKFGTQPPGWFNRLHVVPREGGKRFVVSAQETKYETDPMTMQPKEMVQYFVRYSDDDGATWTSHAFDQKTDGMVRLVAVNPKNPDEIVVAVRRIAPLTPDDLYFSPMAGMPGTYQKIASPTEFSAALFLPDGALYFGDNEQTTPGLFKVAKLGEPPVQVSAQYKVGCLTYDEASDRLYVCADWRFGTADRTTGELSILFDMNDTTDVLVCEGEPDLKEQCMISLRSPNFCDITHYPEAPLCTMHFPAGPLVGETPVRAGASAAAGSSAGLAGSGGSLGSAGAAGSANTGGAKPLEPTTPPASGGCAAAPAPHGAAGPALAGLGLLALAWASRRRRRR